MSRSAIFFAGVAAFAVALLAPVPTWATAPITAAATVQDKDKPKPEIKSMSLFTLKQGQTATVIVYGENLAPTSVTTSKPTLTAKVLETKATETDEAKKRGGKQTTVEVVVAGDCPPDVYELVLVHEGDVKATARLAVVALAESELEVKRPCQTFAEAMPLPSIAAGWVAVNGAVMNGDSPDLFRLDAKAGETWEITLLAGRAGSPLDPVVRIRDARRFPVALSAGHEKRDRVLTLRAPADGPYFIEVGDAEGRGGAQYLYRLAVRRKDK